MTEHADSLGAHMPTGVRFAGPLPGATPGWIGGDHPTTDDIASCVGCGLCLPHCPTYRVLRVESAGPRGRIAAMRAIDEGRAVPDATFAAITDPCLTCRACEDVCPSDVPFGRMMESARSQTRPLRRGAAARLRSFGLRTAIGRRWMLDAAAAATPIVKPLLPKRIRRLIPRSRLRATLARLPAESPATGSERGAVALLSGCVQDRWFRAVNEATIRVLTRNGWRVLVPRDQGCCGALSAHDGQLDVARDLARANVAVLDVADHIVVNAAGCSAHMKDYAELLGGELRAGVLASKVADLMEFLAREGISAPTANPGLDRVAYHDACHAAHAQGIRAQPREVLAMIPGLQIVEVPDGGRCCGAAGIYNVVQPELAGRLGADKAAAIASTGATVIASANPGCSMQIAAHLREAGADPKVLHPVQLLDLAYRAEDTAGRSAS